MPQSFNPSNVFYEGLYFDLMTQTITDYDVNYGTDVVIPEQIQEVDVLYIGEAAFMSKGLTSIIMPNTIIEIKTEGLRGNTLNSITLSQNLEIIGDYAFFGTKCAVFNIPSSVTFIGVEAFANSFFSSLEIPSSVKVISRGAFMNSNIIELILNEGLEFIGTSAFAHNYIGRITIPSSFIVLENAFYNNQIVIYEILGNINRFEEDILYSSSILLTNMPNIY